MTDVSTEQQQIASVETFRQRWCDDMELFADGPLSSDESDVDQESHKKTNNNAANMSPSASVSLIQPPKEKEKFPPLMQEAVTLIDANMNWQMESPLSVSGSIGGVVPKVQPIQLLNLENWPTVETYTVVGVLGKKHVGKSMLLNGLLHASFCRQSNRNPSTAQSHLSQKLSAPFPITNHVLHHKCTTAGVQIYATAEGLILMDTQPLLSMLLADECGYRSGPEAHSYSAHTSTNNNNTTLRGGGGGGHLRDSSTGPTMMERRDRGHYSNSYINDIKIASFVLTVCDIVIVVEDNMCDYQLQRLINDALVLKPIFYKRIARSPYLDKKIGAKANHNASIMEQQASLISVYNKCLPRCLEEVHPLFSLASMTQRFYELNGPHTRSMALHKMAVDALRNESSGNNKQTEGNNPNAQCPEVDKDDFLVTPQKISSLHQMDSVSPYDQVTGQSAFYMVPLVNVSAVSTLTKEEAQQWFMMEDQLSQLRQTLFFMCEKKRHYDRKGKVIHMRRWISFASQVWKTVVQSPLLEEYQRLYANMS